MSDTRPPLAAGGAFVDALARRDFTAMGEALDPAVTFRALLPPGPMQVHGRDETIDRFRGWFGGSEEYEMVDATIGEIGPRTYLRWRIRLTPSDGPSLLIEQHLFATATDRLDGIDLLCSGFVARQPR